MKRSKTILPFGDGGEFAENPLRSIKITGPAGLDCDLAVEARKQLKIPTSQECAKCHSGKK